MKSHTQVAVIGGGIIGASILYHLAKRGWANAVLVEKRELTAGTTWHSAGNSVLADTNLGVSAINVLSWKAYQDMEAETGEYLGLRTTGSIALATNSRLFDLYKARTPDLNRLGVRYEMIDARRVGELHPLVTTDGILGAAYVPDEFTVDPSMATHAFARVARQRGAEIYQNTKAIGFERRGRGWLVQTDKGEILAEQVVICGGMWSPHLARLAGFELPIVATERQYLITDVIPEIEALQSHLPMLRDLAAPFYTRQERNSLLVGVHERAVPFCFEDGIPDEFGMELFPADLDRGMDSLSAAMARLPLLETAGIKTVICGPTSRTPDMQPYLGPVPGLPNLWVAAGFISGAMQGAGAGEIMSRWIVDGDPGVDISAMDVGRIGDHQTIQYTRSMLSEAHIFGAADLFKSRSGGRPARTSPLYYNFAASGARFHADFGWEIPHSFPHHSDTDAIDAVDREIGAIMTGPVVADLTARAMFEIRGKGAYGYFEHLCASNLPEIGMAADCLMLTKQGKVAVLCELSRLPGERFLLSAPASQEKHAYRWLQRHLPEDGSVGLSNLTGQIGCLLVAGPSASQLVAAVVSPQNMETAPTEHSVVETQAGYASCRIHTISIAGHPAYEISVGADFLVGLYERLLAADATQSIQKVGNEALQFYRMQDAKSAWGYDVLNGDSAVPSALQAMITKSRTSFIGYGAVLGEDPINADVVMLTAEMDQADDTRYRHIMVADRIVGNVRSFRFSRAQKRAYLSAAVDPNVLKEPDGLSLSSNGTRFTLEVVQ